MSRRRDTNWSKDEITVLLDSITEITRMRAQDGKRTNSREVFEYAAKKMGEKGHFSRAEREKCRTKWKKMKEEFTHAKRAREGDSRFKEAPGIQPFYERMEEFINGTFDNISPHSTIVRRTSSLSSSSAQASNVANLALPRHLPAMRASARLAANSNGLQSGGTEAKDNSNASLSSNPRIDFLNSLVEQPSDVTPSPRQNSSRLSSGSNNTNNSTNNNDNDNSSTAKISDHSPLGLNSSSGGNHHHRTGSSGVSDAQNRVHLNGPTTNSPPNHHQQAPSKPTNGSGDYNTLFAQHMKTNISNSNNNNSTNGNNEMIALNVGSSNQYQNLSMLTYATSVSTPNSDHADISYRVSTGCRQITIFGDHDVDIKFRGDCVTINKIDNDHTTTTEI